MAAPIDEWGDSDDDYLVELADKLDKQTEDCTKKMLNQSDLGVTTPLKSFRPGYLWVSDFTKQNWCERQMHYSFTVPTLVEDKPVMTEGSNLHLARELAVHDVVNVKVTSSEDIWAIKILNLLTSIQVFLNNGTIAREVPIFGAPFGEDVFIVGLIDELKFDPATFEIDLQELKTRKHKSFPSRSKQTQHRLQVMLYKKLFDDLVKGNVTMETVARHLRLDLKKELGQDIMEQIDHHLLVAKTLHELMTILFEKMQCLTLINQLQIEYVHQESQQTLFHHPVPYDEDELKGLFQHYLQYWQGERESKGVDIEEAWKCQNCDFADICEWRKTKAEEYGKKTATTLYNPNPNDMYTVQSASCDHSLNRHSFL